MKRQMKLILLILQYIEQSNGIGNIALPEFKDYSKSEVSYHVKLCDEAGYIEALCGERDGMPVVIKRLTWRGHEELEELQKKFDI